MKWILLLWPVMAFSQPVWINDDNGIIDRAVVDRTLWIVNQRFGTDFSVSGVTPLGCIEGAITIRRASTQAWLDSKLQLFGNPYALEHDCPNMTHAQAIVFGPDIIGERPIVNNILQHEFLHATGIKHIDSPYALMYQGDITAKAMTMLDMVETDKVNKWSHGRGDKCFAEVFDNYDFYVPSIGGKGVYMSFIDKWRWRVLYAVNTTAELTCPGFTYSGAEVTIPDARAVDGRRWGATLENIGGYWTLKTLTAETME